MQFAEFVRELDGAIRGLGPVEAFDDSAAARASWRAGARSAAVTLVPPLNVSVVLGSPGRPEVTTWYPVDGALVPVVSGRIAAYLRES